jgi:hypothetical protein
MSRRQRNVPRTRRSSTAPRARLRSRSQGYDRSRPSPADTRPRGMYLCCTRARSRWAPDRRRTRRRSQPAGRRARGTRHRSSALQARTCVRANRRHRRGFRRAWLRRSARRARRHTLPTRSTWWRGSRSSCSRGVAGGPCRCALQESDREREASGLGPRASGGRRDSRLLSRGARLVALCATCAGRGMRAGRSAAGQAAREASRWGWGWRVDPGHGRVAERGAASPREERSL